MSKKFQKFLATVLILSQVLTCNAFSVMAQNVNNVSFEDGKSTNQKNYYEEEEMQIVDEDEKESEVDTSLSFDIEEKNEKEDVVNTNYNINNKNNNEYEDEPEEDVVENDTTEVSDANSEEKNSEENKNDNEINDDAKEVISDTEDSDIQNTENENTNETNKIKITVEVDEEETTKEDTENAGINKQTEVEKPTVDITVDVVDEEDKTNTNKEDVGINKQTEIEKPTIDVTATVSEDDEFIFTEENAVGVAFDSDIKDVKTEEEIKNIESNSLLGEGHNLVRRRNIAKYNIFGDFGYVPAEHTNQGIINKGKLNEDKYDHINWYAETGGEIKNKSADWLNKNQNIRGWLYDPAKSDKLTLTEKVYFNSDWEERILQDDTHYHEEGGDDYKKDTKSKLIGMYINEIKNDFSIEWYNNGWKQGNGTHIIKGWDNDPKKVWFPENSKNISCNEEGTWNFIGWAPSYHNTQADNGPGKLNEAMPKEVVFSIEANEALKKNIEEKQSYLLNQQELFIVYPPGFHLVSSPHESVVNVKEIKDANDEIKEVYHTRLAPREMPVTFGPFYRGYVYPGDTVKKTYKKDQKNVTGLISRMYRDGWKWGLADRGLHFTDQNIMSNNTTLWYQFMRVDRSSYHDQIEGSSLKYVATFFSPVFIKSYKRNLTLDKDGGEWVGEYKPPETYDVIPNNIVLPTADNITKDFYTFGGWYTEKNGQGIKYTELGDKEAIKGIKELYAYWIPKSYTFQVCANIATGSDGVEYNGDRDDAEAFPVDYDDNIILPSNEDWSITGFEVIGFSTDKNATTTTLKAGEEIRANSDNFAISNDIIKIYPIYKEKEYTVRLNVGKVGKERVSDKNEKTSDDYTEKKLLHYSKYKFSDTEISFEGFKLKGLSYNNNQTTADIELNTEVKTIDLLDADKISETETKNWYGVWEEKTYNIEFNGNKITASDKNEYKLEKTNTKNVKYFSNITMPNDFSIEDFTLKGFSNNNKEAKETQIKTNELMTVGALSKKISLSETEKNILYAVWEEKEINIIFDGGRPQASNLEYYDKTENKVEKTFKYKTKVEIPQNFEIEGFNFKGYNVEDNKKEVLIKTTDNLLATDIVKTYNEKVKENTITFYGVWEEKKYTLKIEPGSKTIDGKKYEAAYNKNEVGEEVVAEAKTYGYYSNITMPTEMNMKGFRLKGFNKEDDKTEVKYTPGEVESIKNIVEYMSMQESEEYSLYGVWEFVSAEVVLKAGIGLYNDKTIEKVYKVEAIGTTLEELDGYEEPTSKGYEFSYWMDSDNKKYVKTTKIEKDLVLTAVYTEITEEEVNNELYTITISNDEEKGNYIGVNEVKIGLSSKILASMSEAGVVNPVANKGYIFIGWSFDGKNIIKTNDTYVDNTKNNIVAVYEEEKINITLSAGSGEFSEGKKTINIVSTKSMALNEYEKYEEPEKDGFKFINWLNGSEKVASTSIITKDITLIAEYEKVSEEIIEEEKEYVIDIYNDEEKGTYVGVASISITLGDEVLIKMTNSGVVNPIAKEGWRFIGWSYNEADKTNLIKEEEKYIDNTKRIISAVYEEEKYEVVLSAAEGVFSDGKKSKTLTSVREIALREFLGYEEPERDEYEFVRWLEGDIEVASTSIIRKNTTLIATYKKIGKEISDGKYTITITSDSEKGVIKQNGEEKDEIKITIEKDENIIEVLNREKITAEGTGEWKFNGWSWTGYLDDIIKNTEKYENTTNRTLKAVYSKGITVILKAETGIFKSNRSRKIEITTDVATALENITNYEEPIKNNATFSKWIKEDDTEFNKSDIVTNNIILYAVYKNNKTGEEEGKKGTETGNGGSDATYTVYIKSEVRKGTLSNADSSVERVEIDGTEYYVAYIDIKEGDKILKVIDEEGIKVETPAKYVFDGWTKDNTTNLIKEDDTYNKETTEIAAVFYDILSIKVKLNANTGLFNVGENKYSREIELTSITKTKLENFVNYKEPFKSEGFTFKRWEDETGKVYNKTYLFNEEYSGKIIELYAIYEDKNGNTIGKGDSKDGKDKANYTVVNIIDEEKSTITNKSFEVKKDANVKQAMIDYKAYYTEEVEGWYKKGWSFTNKLTELIKNETKYEDTTKTDIYAQYIPKDSYIIVLDANTGLFKDNTRTKTLVSKTNKLIKYFDGYDEPIKSAGFKFDHWEREGLKVSEDSYPVYEDVDDIYVLTAIYKNSKNEEIGKGESKDGQSEATYTIRVENDSEKGTIGDITTFEIKQGNYIISSMSEAGIKNPEAKEGYYFVGWSWAKTDYDHMITKKDIYKGNEGSTVLYTMYSDEILDITLDANTGLFSDNKRERKLQIPKYKLLIDADDYEEPVKGEYTFNRWQKEDGTPLTNLSTYKVSKTERLTAIYSNKDKTNNDVGQDDDTKDGGSKAVYTVKVINDKYSGEYYGAEYFDIKIGEVIYTTMKEKGVKEGEAFDGKYFKGWRIGESLITALTTYEDKNLTEMYLEYATADATITFDTSFGQFVNGDRLRGYVVGRGRVINTIEGYEEPTKANWTFNRWVDTKTGETVASTSIVPTSVVVLNLKAMYLNKDGEEVDENSHNHLICGSNDTVSHSTEVISTHDKKVSYLPVSTSEEFSKYIEDEAKKEELNRQDVYMYLENDIELNKDLYVDKNMNVYICLNGYNLTQGKIASKETGSGNVYITNCQLKETTINEKATDSEIAMYGRNGLHILSSRGRINVKANGDIVDVVNKESSIAKDIEFMYVNIESQKGKNIIRAEGNSSIRIVDTNINNVEVENSIISAKGDANIYLGGLIEIRNNKTNKYIMEVDNVINIAEHGVLDIEDNNIEKKENGNTALLLINNDNNYVNGDIIIKNNKLIFTKEYEEKVKPEEETSPSEANNLYGAYELDEEEEEVGKSAAVIFTKENAGFHVGNSNIEIKDNTSVANYENIKAGYMYQLVSKNNDEKALIRQNIGTKISTRSVIGVSFETTDGEGILTNSSKITSDNFLNKTYGKEENLLNIKDNEDGEITIKRKTYYVEYDEGEARTNNSKKLIDTYTEDGEEITEDTKVRSEAIKAGYGFELENSDIYVAKGFDLATYSIIDKNNNEVGKYTPKSSVSYINKITNDFTDIEDGDVITAKANWKEKALKSEARELVVTKEVYDKIMEDTINTEVKKIASQSEAAEEEEEETEDDFYTVRYYLDGGRIEGQEAGESGYIEINNVSRKQAYKLITNVTKQATESNVLVEYDFDGWLDKEEEDIEEIKAGYEGDLVEVYAQYQPTYLNITYHMQGGKVDGHEIDEEIKERFVRKEKFTLLEEVEKENYSFTGWYVTDEETSGEVEGVAEKEIEAERFYSDVHAYAQYKNALYTIKYDLNDGIIKNKTKEGDKTYEESVSSLKDYYLYQEVTKEGFEFTGWENKKGKIIEKIPAGNTEEENRELIATFKSITYTVNYDANGGTVHGVANLTEKVNTGYEYMLYTDVVKEGWELDYWYDIQTNEKLKSIKNGIAGRTYNLRAEYKRAYYDLTLIINKDKTEKIEKINAKYDYYLPTDIEIPVDEEFGGWYYEKDGKPVIIDSIEAGNPEDITEVIALYNSLLTRKVVYHLPKGYSIKNSTSYDVKEEDSDEITKTEKVNRNKDYNLSHIAEWDEAGDEYEFYGWTINEFYEAEEIKEDELDSKILKKIVSYKTTNKERNATYDVYPYFVKLPETTTTIKYNLDGGQLEEIEAEDTYEVEVSADTKYILYNPEKENHRFIGWYYDQYLTEEVSITESLEYVIDKDILNKKIGDTINVFAAYKKINKLTYKTTKGIIPGVTNGEEWTTEYEVVSKEEGYPLDKVGLRIGYEFLGWYLSEDEDAEKIEKIEYGYDKDITVYAKWRKVNYNVTYVLHGGVVNGKNKNEFTETYSRLEDTTLITDVYLEDHLFTGWFTKENGQGEKYERILKSNEEIKDITLHANYEDITYTITYDLAGGKLNGKTLNEDGKYVEKYDNRNKVVLYERESISHDNGYFVQWTDEKDNVIEVLPIGHSGNITVKANYIYTKEEFTFYTYGGAIRGKATKDGQTYVIKYDITQDFELPTLNPTSIYNHTTGQFMAKADFDGWYDNAQYTGQKITKITKGNPNKTNKLYAKWIDNSYRIVYHLNGGEVPLRFSFSDTLQDNANIKYSYDVASPYKKYNYFEGWYYYSNFSGQQVTEIPKNPANISNGQLHLYAKWNQYRTVVTYVSELGGGKSELIKKPYNYTKYLLEDENLDIVKRRINYANGLSKKYVFDGWYQKQDGKFEENETYYIERNIQNNITVYAKFVDTKNFTDEEKEELEKRKETRDKIRAEIKSKISEEQILYAEEETKIKQQNTRNNEIQRLLYLFWGMTDEDIEEDDETLLSSKDNTKNNNLLLGFANTLLGDGEETTEEASPSEAEEINISLADLLAYDTISAETLGLETPTGTVLSGIVITYMVNTSGKKEATSYVGTVLEAGKDFSDIAETYPDYTLGARAIFIDESLLPKETSNPGSYYPGGGGGGGGAGGIVQTANNGVPIIDDDSTYSSSIGQVIVNGVVNPYGFSGRGNDNGAMNVAMNSVNLVEAVNKYQTYATVDLSNTTFQDLQKLGEGYFEYFPASNGYKYFYLNKLGVRTYVRNGWNYVKTQSGYRWLMFDSDGMMMRGFVNYKGNTYYLRNSLDGIAYMMTGFVEWKKVGIVAYFNENGALQNIFSKEEASKFMQVNAISSQVNFSAELLTKVILYDRELNVISKTVKTVGSTALGNFVGYWYYFKDGRKRFRFETINKNLQMSKFAKNGWITVFDDKFKESSYKFAANGDLIVNTKTEEGIEVDAIGQAKVNNTVTKLNIITKPIDTNFVKGAEVDRYYEVNVSTADMVSKEVDDRGITKDITKATRIFTTTPLENELVALNQTKK